MTESECKIWIFRKMRESSYKKDIKGTLSKIWYRFGGQLGKMLGGRLGERLDERLSESWVGWCLVG
jgi:hypothetical protein